MTQLSELQHGSFRGARFLLGTVSTTGGRKQVTHEYPQADRRVVEDLGLLNRTFTINGLVTTSTARDDLLRALESPGSGELVHPYFGAVKVHAKPYTVNENINELGVVRFTMSFERSEAPIYPKQGENRKALINSKAVAVESSVSADIESTFDGSIPSNYSAAQSKLLEIAGAFTGVGLGSALDSSAISTYSKALLVFQNGIDQNILNPSNLASTFTNLMQKFGVLSSDAASMLNLALSFADFGSGDSEIPATTVQRKQREANRKLLNGAVRANAIAQAYNNAVNIDFASARALEDAEQELELAYEAFILDTGLSETTVEALEDLRTEVQLFFDKATLSAYKISSVDDVHTQPMTILAYSYYGSTDNTQSLIDLNGTINSTFVSGTIELLTP